MDKVDKNKGKKRIGCATCQQSGKVMGLGCIVDACDDCKGLGFTFEKIPGEKVSIDKRSASYKKAIAEIKKLNPDLSDADAAAEFDKISENLGEK